MAMFTKRFWMDLGERVVASAAGGALAVMLAGSTTGDSSAINWAAVGIGAGTAALVSLLKGLIASRTGDPQSASLVE